MGTNAALSPIPGAAGCKGSEEAEGWAGGSGRVLGTSVFEPLPGPSPSPDPSREPGLRCCPCN